MIRAILIAAAIVSLVRCSNVPPQSFFSPVQVRTISTTPPPASVVDTPAPLGALAVAAAFVWSRRLRQRVKATQSLTTKP